MWLNLYSVFKWDLTETWSPRLQIKCKSPVWKCTDNEVNGTVWWPIYRECGTPSQYPRVFHLLWNKNHRVANVLETLHQWRTDVDQHWAAAESTSLVRVQGQISGSPDREWMGHLGGPPVEQDSVRAWSQSIPQGAVGTTGRRTNKPLIMTWPCRHKHMAGQYWLFQGGKLGACR